MFALGGEERAREKRKARATGRWARLTLSLAAVLLTSMVTAACSSSTTPTAQVSATSSLNESGFGNKVLPPVTLPSRWTVIWRFNCQQPSTRRPFAIRATGRDGSPITVTRQTGLGGGGDKMFSAPGTFTFAITTSCNWDVSAASAKAGASTA